MVIFIAITHCMHVYSYTLYACMHACMQLHVDIHLCNMQSTILTFILDIQANNHSLLSKLTYTIINNKNTNTNSYTNNNNSYMKYNYWCLNCCEIATGAEVIPHVF